jgi:photosystem II stability/assembly factor-like uncharacterized protein
MRTPLGSALPLGLLSASALVVALDASCIIPLSTNDLGGDGGSSGGGSSGSPQGFGDAAPPSGKWTPVTNNLSGLMSECGTVCSVFSKPDEDLLIAGVAGQGGLWSSRDGAASWQHMNTGAGASVMTNRPLSLAFDPDPMYSKRFWESGVYGGNGGVYETTDDGTSFTQLGTVFHNDLVSVDFTDPARKTLLAGGHEQSQTLWKSTDGGQTWQNIAMGTGLPANTNCTLPLIIDTQNYLVGCAGYGGGPSGIYRSTNGGANWTLATASGGGNRPLRAKSDGSIYWISPGNNGMTRSTDNGVHWTDVLGPGVLTSYVPIELPDGRIAALGLQYVMVSKDHGATWNPASAALPYMDGVGVAYSGPHKAFYVYHIACGNGTVLVPADAIMRFDWDYTTNP